MTIGKNASKQNPALKELEYLIGEWDLNGVHPMFPGAALTGRSSISWLEGGAFLMIRSEVDHPKFPHGIEIIGSDDAAGTLYMLHFDERGVSRKYDVTCKDGELTWWRNDPAFSQRFTLKKIDDNTLASTGRMSRDGGDWEGDLELHYTRSLR